MQQDIWKILAFMSVAAAFGLVSGQLLAALLVCSLMVIAWYVYRLQQLYRWLRNPTNEPLPTNSGLFYLIFREISRRNTKYSARKRQLKSHLAQFQRAAGVIPDAIVLIDADNKIEWANNNAARLLGIEWPRDAKLRFTDLVRNPACAALLEQPDAQESGIEVSLSRNRDRTLNMSCAKYTTELRMVMARDVSHLVKVNALHKQFVANVSHELKTPLTVLKGYLEILQSHPQLAPVLQSPIEQMTQQSERMEIIVADLLYLSRLEHTEGASQQQPLEVTQLINGVVESVQSLIANKHHKLELDIDYEVSLIGNQAELHSAFCNILNNAIRYTDAGGIIKIRWQKRADGAMFSIKDNGIGIPAHAIPSLTRRFYRVNDDRSREDGGTGLGLAIVKHVLQRHDAQLEIISELGQGSEFRCLFPSQRVSRQNYQMQIKDQ